MALPSAVPDYDFVFSATVWWRQLPNPGGVVHIAPDTLATDAVLARARAITEREHPGRPELVRHRLDGLLGTLSPDNSGIVVAMAGQVGLALSEADRARLDKLAEVRKTEEIWDHERRYERSKRSYLGEDVLKSPGSAVVWWLARNDEEVQGAVDMIGPLAQLAAAANDEAVDVLYRHLVATGEAGSVDDMPFFDAVVPEAATGNGGSMRDVGDVGDVGDEGGVGGVGPFGPARPWAEPARPERGPSVVGPLNELMDDIELREDGDRTVYAHRVARFTEAAGRPDAADRIWRSLGDDGDDGDDGASGGGVGRGIPGVGGGGGNPAGPPSQEAAPADAPDGVPGQRVFVVGPVQPRDGGEPEPGPVTSAWEVLRGSVDGDPRGSGSGDPRGTGDGTGEGWGGADQSHE
ncbi:hypothetical protein [Kitasatospora purpeofusca]|uniref:hypothetical protein n=1 Tax=Kitasatospora purpeofusca TaxID=67352 RepID=UPI0036D2D5D6